MDREKEITTKDNKEDNNIAAIAKPSINLPVIDISKSKEFIKNLIKRNFHSLFCVLVNNPLRYLKKIFDKYISFVLNKGGRQYEGISKTC